MVKHNTIFMVLYRQCLFKYQVYQPLSAIDYDAIFGHLHFQIVLWRVDKYHVISENSSKTNSLEHPEWYHGLPQSEWSKSKLDIAREKGKDRGQSFKSRATTYIKDCIVKADKNYVLKDTAVKGKTPVSQHPLVVDFEREITVSYYSLCNHDYLLMTETYLHIKPWPLPTAVQFISHPQKNNCNTSVWTKLKYQFLGSPKDVPFLESSQQKCLQSELILKIVIAHKLRNFPYQFVQCTYLRNSVNYATNECKV